MTTTAASVSPRSEPATGACLDDERHLVEFYENDAYLADSVARFLGHALHGTGAAIVVATPAHCAAFDEALTAAGVDVAGATSAGRYLTFDAAGLLARFMANGAPDRDTFFQEVGGLLAGMTGPDRTLRIYGEMVALLWEGGDAASAVVLEDLWNEIGAIYDFDLLCAYRMSPFDNEDGALAFRRVCEQHTTRPEQVLLAELAYADAMAQVINRRTSEAGGPAFPTLPQVGADTLALTAWRKASLLMASPGGRVLGDIVATEFIEAPAVRPGAFFP